LKIFLTILACIIVAFAGVVGFIYSGIYDVAALQPDNSVVAWALHTTSNHSVQARLGGIEEPPNLDKPDVIQSGARFFGSHCVVCHGGPGLVPTAIAQGLNPAPPNLFKPTRKPQTTEMFWVIKNGLKMTAMPGFGKTQSDQQIWAIAAFLRKAPGISAQDFAAQTGAGVTSPDTPKPSGN
jgi:mono/diheme cytochrome c family protein